MPDAHHPPLWPYTTTAQTGPVWVPDAGDAPNALLVPWGHMLTMPQLNPVVCSQPDVPQAASSSTRLTPGGLSLQGPCCTAMCHGSVSVIRAQHRAAGEVLRCCRAGAQWDVNSAWSGSVPSLLGTPTPMAGAL